MKDANRCETLMGIVDRVENIDGDREQFKRGQHVKMELFVDTLVTPHDMVSAVTQTPIGYLNSPRQHKTSLAAPCPALSRTPPRLPRSVSDPPAPSSC